MCQCAYCCKIFNCYVAVFAGGLLSLECVNIYTVEVKRRVKCIPGIVSTIAGEYATIVTITKWKALTDERKILLLITYIIILCAK